jgi:hypothetical protein
VGLRPGTYAISFTLPGFSTAKHENVELTSDFTAQVNVELKVGSLELTVNVAPRTPVVDVQGITQRTVMTRDVLDAMPTGRNIQAAGILIPGTNLSFGGGAAISRDVGGSGGLQQSPLAYRGSNDAVQTIEGMRLNNLCANGAYSGVYWNDGSLQEISYVTGADSVEMGQGASGSTWCPGTAATRSGRSSSATTRRMVGHRALSARISTAITPSTRATRCRTAR